MLKIDASLFVVFAIVWILLIILKKVFFNPLRRLLDSRNTEVQGDLGACREAAAEQKEIMREIEERLKAAKAATRETQDRFVTEALREKEKMLAEIAREFRTRIDEARAQLREQMEDLKKELASESALLADQIEERLLQG